MNRRIFQRRRILLAGALLPLGVLIGVFLWNRNTPTPNVSDAASKADITLDHFRHQASEEGTIRWEIEAESAGYFKSDEQATLVGITARFHPDSGDIVTVTAQKGQYAISEGHLILTGNVRVRQKELQLSSETLEYSEETETLRSPGPTKIEGDGLRFTANQALYSVPKDQLTLSGKVEGTIDDSRMP